MNYSYEFDFNFIFSDSFINAFLENKIQNANIKQKDLIKKLDIPSSTFTRVKRNGYTSNKNVYQALQAYFSIKPIDMAIYHKLKTLINEIFTLIYYELPNHQEKIYNAILKYADLTKNSPLRLLFWLVLAISCNIEHYSSPDILIMLEKDLEFIDAIKPFLPYDALFITDFALFHYSLQKNNLILKEKYANELETLLPKVCEQLHPLGYFAIMNTAATANDYLKGINYAIKCLELQNNYFSPRVRIAIKYHLFYFYSMVNDYPNMIKVGAGEILHLQFNDNEKAFYISFLIGLAQAYINEAKYLEAQKMLNNINTFVFDRKINPSYQKIIKEKIKLLSLNKLFMYYKINDENKFSISLQECQNLNCPTYLEIIQLFQKKNISSLKRVKRLLDILEDKDKCKNLSNLCYALKIEYQRLIAKYI